MKIKPSTLKKQFPEGSAIIIVPKQLAENNTGVVTGYQKDSLIVTYEGKQYKCSDPVKITCYGETEAWAMRQAATDFYSDGVLECEGSEQIRYLNVYSDLISGKQHCSDGEAAHV